MFLYDNSSLIDSLIRSHLSNTKNWNNYIIVYYFNLCQKEGVLDLLYNTLSCKQPYI